MGVGRALDVDRGVWGQPRLLGGPRWEVGPSKQKRAGGRCLRARARRAWVPCGPGKQRGARAAELAVAWGLAGRDRRAGHGIAVGPKGEGWTEGVGLGLSPVGVFYFLSLLFFFKQTQTTLKSN